MATSDRLSTGSWLATQSPRRIAGASFVAIALIGVADWYTGYEASFSIFYLLPILVGAWSAGRLTGLALCALSAGTELVADVAGGLLYSSPLVHVWNAAVHLTVFATLAVVLDSLRRALDRERRLARRDPLTGLANRTSFFEFAAAEVDRCQRYGRGLTLAYVDCDHFKEVNDARGHEAGDACLKAVAETLSGAIRRTDLAARLGGDEFALMFPELEEGEALEVIQKVQQRLTERMAAGRWGVTFSIGVVSTRAPSSVDALLQRADGLMYEVKRHGRDGIALEPEPERHAVNAA